MSKYSRFAAMSLAILTVTGCQGITGAPDTAQIRIVDASPDAPMLDIYQGPAALSYNLAFGNITSYIPTTSGPISLSASPSGSRQTLTATHESLVPGQYTLLVGNTTASLRQLLLKDQNEPAPAGHTALRFVDQVTAPTPFDVYLLTSGAPVNAASPILPNQSFGSVSGYLNVPAGSYRIVLYPAGASPSPAVPAAYSGITVTYASGTVRTVILLDQKIPLRPLVQIVTARDADPPPQPTSAPQSGE